MSLFSEWGEAPVILQQDIFRYHRFTWKIPRATGLLSSMWVQCCWCHLWLCFISSKLEICNNFRVSPLL